MKLEKRRQLYETKLVFLDDDLSLFQFHKAAERYEKKIDEIEEKIEHAKAKS